MIKLRLPAGYRCLSAQSERFSSINACHLMPAVPYTTETLSFPIYHTLGASEPQLALLETGLPSSLAGLHWNNSSSCYSLWSFFTVSYVLVEGMFAEFGLETTTLGVSHCMPLGCLSSPSISKSSVSPNQAEFNKQSGSNGEDWSHQLKSLLQTGARTLNSWEASMVNDQKMAIPDGPSSRV